MFDYDATAVTRLREAGAVLLGKLATGELAVGDLWFRGRTRNPWNPDARIERIVRRTGLGDVRRTCRLRDRHGNQRIDHVAGVDVRRRGSAADVRPREPVRLHDAAMDARQGRRARAIGGRRRRSCSTRMHGPDGHDETVADLPFAWDGGRDVKGLRIGYRRA